MGLLHRGRGDRGLDEAQIFDARLPPIDWATLPDGAQTMAFDAPSGQLAAISMGPADGDRVVLVPGVTGSKEDFILVMPILARAGYRVESFDIAGQYESATAGTADGARFDYEVYIRDLAAFLEAGPPAHVLGYSFSGVVAEQTIVRYPHLFRSLALMSVPPDAGNGFRRMRWVGPISGLATGPVAANLMVWGIKGNLNGAPAERWSFAKSRFALTNMTSVQRVLTLMMHIPDVFADVAQIPVPKLIAAGTHDLWKISDHERHAKAIGATLTVYETGHSPCETTPHQLSRDLLRLYAGH